MASSSASGSGSGYSVRLFAPDDKQLELTNVTNVSDLRSKIAREYPDLYQGKDFRWTVHVECLTSHISICPVILS